MGWVISFEPEIYLRGKSFSNLYELECAIEEEEGVINYYEQKLAMLTAATPPDNVEDEYGISFLQRELRDLLEGYRESIRILLNLTALLEYKKENPDFNMTGE